MISDQYPVLRTLLGGKDPVLLSEAARLAGDFGLEALSEPLLRCAVHSPYYSKAGALFALQKIVPSEARRAAAELFADPRVPDDFYWHCFRAVRASGALVLAWHGDPDAIGFLRDSIEAKDPVTTRWLAEALLDEKTPATVRKRLTLSVLADEEALLSYRAPPYSDPGQICLLCGALGVHPDARAAEILRAYSLFHSRYVRVAAIRSLARQIGSAETLAWLERIHRIWDTPSDRIERAALLEDTKFLVSCRGPGWTPFEIFQAVDRLDAIGHSAEAAAFLDEKWDAVRQRAVEALARSPQNTGLLESRRGGESSPRVLASLEAAGIVEKAP